LTGEGIFRLTLNRPPERNMTLPNKVIARGVPWSLGLMGFSDPEGMPMTFSATGLPPGIALSGGTYSGTPTTEGTYTVTVMATDSGGLTATSSFNITVENRAPQQTGGLIANQSTMLGQPFSFSFAANIFTDPNLDAVSYSATGMPPGITFNPSTRTFSGTPTATGTYTVTVTASDGRLSASTTFGIAVANSNAPAVAFPISDLNVETGYPYTKIIPSNTFNGTNLTWTVARTDGLAFPAWMVWDPIQHKFSGTPTGIANASFDVRVTVRDDQNRTAFDEFHVFKLGSGSNNKMMASSGSAEAVSADASTGVTASAADQHGASRSLSSYITTNMSVMSSQPEEALQYDLAVAPISLATAFNTSGALQMSWFTYDEDNRTIVHQGQLVNGQVMAAPGGYIQRYDAAGNAVLKLTLQFGEKFQYIRTTYNLRGQIIGVGTPMSAGQPEGITLETRRYDDSGRLLEIRRFYRQGYTLQGKDVGGLLESAESYQYDADGRVREVINRARSQDRNSDGTFKWLSQLDLSDPAVRAAQASNLDLLFKTASTRYYTNVPMEDIFGTGAYGYNYQGNLKGYQFEVYKDGENSLGYVHSYTYTYHAGEQYLEKSVSGSSTESQFKATTVTSYYDRYGRRLAVEESTPKVDQDHTLKLFSYNGDGQILTRRDGTFDTNGQWIQTARGGPWTADGDPEYPDNPVQGRMSESTWLALSSLERKAILLADKNQRYVYANGQLVAQGSQAGKLNVLESLTAYGDAGASRTQLAVQAGDTLRSIATRVYGNGDLWYVIADANGMQSDRDLVAGTLLTVPSVKVSSNDAETFKPYDPGAIVGSTTPDMPFIAAPPKNHCSAVAIVLMVVAVVVAFVVAPYLAPYIAQALGAVGITSAAVVTGVTAGASMAVGSAVSQGLGSAAGVSSFSWRQVAVDGISAGITAGMGSYLSGVGKLTTTAANGVATLNSAGRVVQGLASYGGSVVANATVGRDTNFSWNAVATTAVSSYLGSELNPNGSVSLTDGTTDAGRFFNNFAGGYLDGGINATARRVMGGGKQDWRQVAVDAFGNALGNAAVGKIQSWQANRAGGATDQDDLMQRWHEEDKRQLQMEIAAEEQSRLPDWSSLNQSAPYDVNARSLNDIVLQGRGGGEVGAHDAEIAAELAALNREQTRLATANAQLANAQAQWAAKASTAHGPYGPDGGYRYSESGLEIDIIGGRVATKGDNAFANVSVDTFLRDTDNYLAAQRQMRDPLAGIKWDLSQAQLNLDPATGRPYPHMQARDSAAEYRQQLKFHNDLGIAYLGPLFGSGAAATRVLGGNEAQVQAGLEAGVIGMDLLTGGRGGTRAANVRGGRVRPPVPNSRMAAELDRLAAEGHAIGRHGGAITDEQLIVRARTGVAPDGSISPRGRTPDSTAFYTDDHLAAADQFLRQNYLDDAIANAAPGQVRLKVSADMGVPVGRGFLPVGKTQGLSGPLLKVDNISSVEAWYVLDPSKNVWQTNTIYPRARP
jgi:hypothetical protein